MAKRVVTATYLTIATVEYAAQLAKAELVMTSDTPDSTNMASGGWKEFLAGLKSWTLSVSFKKDADLSGLDAAMFTAFNGGAAQAIVLRGTSAAVSTSNAQYAGSIIVNNWTPISGAVGDVFGADYTWQGTGAITRTTA